MTNDAIGKQELPFVVDNTYCTAVGSALSAFLPEATGRKLTRKENNGTGSEFNVFDSNSRRGGVRGHACGHAPPERSTKCSCRKR